MKDKILSGTLAVGSKVPQEDEICQQYNVSAITVRKAMAFLVEEGLVERVRGSGTFVKSQFPLCAGDSDKSICLVLANRYGEFPGNIIAGAEEAARKAGYKLQVHVSNEDYGLEREHLERILVQRPSGVILLCVWHQDVNPNCAIYLEYRDQGVPLVFIDRYIPMLPLDYVVNADYEGGYSIAEHFIKLGHKKIGYIREPEGLTSVEARYASFQKAMADNALAINSKHILYCSRNPLTPNPGEEYYNILLKELRELGNDLPSAFLCEADRIAIPLYMALMTLGVKMPEAVAIGGFGDTPIGAILPIPLTTVQQQLDQLGSKAVGVVLDRVSGKASSEPIQISLATKLVVRSSCGSNIPDVTPHAAGQISIQEIRDQKKRIKGKILAAT